MILLLFFIPIPIKTAVRIDIDTAGEVFDWNALVGEQVTLLCVPHFGDSVTEMIKLFEVIAIGDEDGGFRAVPSILVYSHPYDFIGHAIKRYNCGFQNRFVFRGELRYMDRGTKYYATRYHVDLVVWDIVYPVYHHELDPLSHTEFYRTHLFLFDYFRCRPAAYN